MARLKRKTHDLIDHDLDWALSTWRELPEVEKGFDRWGTSEKVDYVYEWAIEEDRLSRLDRHAAAGAMTKEQAARHEELKELVEKTAP